MELEAVRPSKRQRLNFTEKDEAPPIAQTYAGSRSTLKPMDQWTRITRAPECSVPSRRASALNLHNYPSDHDTVEIALWVVQKLDLVRRINIPSTSDDEPLSPSFTTSPQACTPSTSRTSLAPHNGLPLSPSCFGNHFSPFRLSTPSSEHSQAVEGPDLTRVEDGQSRPVAQRSLKSKQRFETGARGRENNIVALGKAETKEKYGTDPEQQGQRQDFVETKIREDLARLMCEEKAQIYPELNELGLFKVGFSSYLFSGTCWEDDVFAAGRLLVDVLPAICEPFPTTETQAAVERLILALKQDKPSSEAFASAIERLSEHHEVLLGVKQLLALVLRQKQSTKPRSPSSDILPAKHPNSVHGSSPNRAIIQNNLPTLNSTTSSQTQGQDHNNDLSIALTASLNFPIPAIVAPPGLTQARSSGRERKPTAKVLAAGQDVNATKRASLTKLTTSPQILIKASVPLPKISSKLKDSEQKYSEIVPSSAALRRNTMASADSVNAELSFSNIHPQPEPAEAIRDARETEAAKAGNARECSLPAEPGQSHGRLRSIPGAHCVRVTASRKELKDAENPAGTRKDGDPETMSRAEGTQNIGNGPADSSYQGVGHCGIAKSRGLLILGNDTEIGNRPTTEDVSRQTEMQPSSSALLKGTPPGARTKVNPELTINLFLSAKVTLQMPDDHDDEGVGLENDNKILDAFHEALAKERFVFESDPTGKGFVVVDAKSSPNTERNPNPQAPNDLSKEHGDPPRPSRGVIIPPLNSIISAEDGKLLSSLYAKVAKDEDMTNTDPAELVHQLRQETTIPARRDSQPSRSMRSNSHLSKNTDRRKYDLLPPVHTTNGCSPPHRSSRPGGQFAEAHHKASVKHSPLMAEPSNKKRRFEADQTVWIVPNARLHSGTRRSSYSSTLVTNGALESNGGFPTYTPSGTTGDFTAETGNEVFNGVPPINSVFHKSPQTERQIDLPYPAIKLPPIYPTMPQGALVNGLQRSNVISNNILPNPFTQGGAKDTTKPYTPYNASPNLTSHPPANGVNGVQSFNPINRTPHTPIAPQPLRPSSGLRFIKSSSSTASSPTYGKFSPSTPPKPTEPALNGGPPGGGTIINSRERSESRMRANLLKGTRTPTFKTGANSAGNGRANAKVTPKPPKKGGTLLSFDD